MEADRRPRFVWSKGDLVIHRRAQGAADGLALDAAVIRRGWRRLAAAMAWDAAFDPAKHPRGHPGNVGEFSSTGGGVKQTAPAATAAPQAAPQQQAFQASVPPQAAAPAAAPQQATAAPAQAPAAAPQAAAPQPPYRPGLKAHGAAWASERKKLWRKSAPNDIDKLIAMSPANQQALANVCAQAAQQFGLEWKDPGVKKTDRIMEKLQRGKTVQEVNDAVRGGFDTPTPQQSEQVVRQLARSFEVADEGWTRTPEGYFDRKAMVRFSDGQIGEVQMWPPGMLNAKEKQGGHAMYEEWQKTTDPVKRDELTEKMNALYKGVSDKLDPVWHSVFQPNVA